MNSLRQVIGASILAVVLVAGGAARGGGDDSLGTQDLDQGLTQPRPFSRVVKIGGRNVRISITAYRNMMPPVDAASSGIQTSVTGSTDDPRGLPPTFTPSSVRLLQGRRAWQGPLSRLGLADMPNSILRRSAGGPTWEVGSRVNAIVEYRLGGRTYRVGLTGGEVGAVY